MKNLHGSDIIGDISAILKIFGLHPKCPHCVTEFAYIYHPRRPEAMKSRHKSQAPIPRNTLNQGVQLFSQDQQTSQQNLFASF